MHSLLGCFLPNNDHKYFSWFVTLCFLCFLFLLHIFRDYLWIKSRNALLLNIRRVHLVNFVTINLLGELSCFFLVKKVKVFIVSLTRNIPVSTNLWRAQISTFGIMIAKLCVF